MKLKIEPLYDRVVVQRLEEKDITKGGIIIPDTAKEKPMEGKIVAVGAGKMTDEGKQIPLKVKKGDKVLLGKWSGTEVKIEGEEYIILKEEEILAIVKE